MLLRNWFGRGRTLPAEVIDQLAAWQKLAAPDAGAPIVATRCVVVDTETSGLDTARDRLLSIGAVAIQGGRILLADSFEATLRQARTSAHANIIVHGIGETAQRNGEEPGAALVRWLNYAGKCPLVAYHAPFDETFVKRALKEHLGLRHETPWVDLATLLPALFDAKPHQALDYWLERFGIDVPVRHSALGDALATAQLAQLAMHQAGVRGLLNFAALSKLAADARWLPR